LQKQEYLMKDKKESMPFLKNENRPGITNR
jgi:hypothetical protein